MSKLEPYKKKRDFNKTKEPKGREGSTEGRTFVIQRHDATRLHYDLRLEIDGVLVSWAVPKEPPMKRGIKRLAVHVEDHPMEYAAFEGRIPKGQYGAGLVEIWDKGTYTPKTVPMSQALKDGKVEFHLHGEILTGFYALIRLANSDKDEWLWMLLGEEKTTRQKRKPEMPVVEEDEDTEKIADIPKELKPMLCETPKKLPSGEGWLTEVKWDGYRILGRIADGKAAFYTRNGIKLDLPELEREFSSKEWNGSWIDGELVAFDTHGVSQFGLLQDALAQGRTSRLVWNVFDLPFFKGYDIRHLPIEERKSLLEQALAVCKPERARYSGHVEVDDLNEAVEAARSARLEGIVCKQGGSTYESARSRSWIKHRCEHVLTGKIIGVTPLSTGQKSVGAIIVGVEHEDGKVAVVGKVGTGFTEEQRARLYKRHYTDPTEPHPNWLDAGLTGKIVWVEPRDEVDVQFLSWTDSGLMRQPKLLEIREKRLSTRHKKHGSRPKPTVSGVTISNPDRIVDEESGSTKGDVATFYEEIADELLPWIKDRTLSVVRCPGGLAEQCFFQKHWLQGLQGGVVEVEVDDDDEPYMAVESHEGIVSLIQMGVIEFHTWGSTTDNLECPDQIIFDLDPGEKVSRDQLVSTTLHVKKELDKLGLPTFAKLSGGKGYHVVVPIKPELEWSAVKDFAQTLTKGLAQQRPKTIVSTMSKEKRVGKTFVDYLRNGRGATAISPYSLRAREGLTVAMPVTWGEMEKLRPDAFTIWTAREHVIKRENDPWESFFDQAVSLKKLFE